MNSPIYQTPLNRRSRAADFRKRARLALSNRWVLAVAIGVIATVIGSIGSAPSLTVKAPTDNGGDSAEMLKYLYRTLLSARTVLVSLFAVAIQIFVSAPVSVGYSRFNLDLLDGRQDAGFATLFSPFRTCYWRAVGVRVLLTLIPSAIMLICGVICGILLAIPIFCGYSLSFYTAEAVAGAGIGGKFMLYCILFACLAVLLVGGAVTVAVAYQYSLCNYILTEYPTLGVLDVLRNSRMLMKGNKWRQFCLHFSYIGWMLLATCCTCGLGLFVVSPYLSVADAAFYDEVSGRATAKEVEFPSVNPEDYFLN